MKFKEACLLILILVVDQVTKYWVQMDLRVHQGIEVIPNFFEIVYAKNTGAGWSILEGKMVFFYIMTILAVILFSVMLVKAKGKSNWYRIALVLILAGALGNFIDRLLLQYVRDFLSFNIFGYPFPIFNVADMALTLGFGCLLIYICFFEEKEKAHESN